MEELLSNSYTAQTLSEMLPDKTAEQWHLWLQNNRNQSRRVPYRIPFVRMAGGVFYYREELIKFSEWERGRQQGAIKLTGRAAEVLEAFGIGSSTGSATGRKLKITSITPQQDEGTGKPFVQLIMEDPLRVYRLETDEALRIADDLTVAARQSSRVKRRTLVMVEEAVQVGRKKAGPEEELINQIRKEK
ncbi:MAG: hypothetical protein ACYCWB_06960 [Thiobacillus sp.]